MNVGTDDAIGGGVIADVFAELEVFTDLDELGLEGVMIFCGGKMTAFSVFSIFNGTCIVHFEKYDRAVKGAAQAVNYETAKAVLGRCRYINREQDLGIEGLREFKKYLRPSRFLKKNSICARHL